MSQSTEKFCANDLKFSAASTQSKLLRFPEKLSTANYVLLRPDMGLVREELSVCTWLKKRLDQSKKGLPWFSYAVAGGDNTILLKAAAHLALIASGNYFNMPYTAEIMRDEWYHMCFTWKSGRADFYVNGVWVYIGEVQPKGQIPLGGTLVLGQEQDSPGGGFDINDVYAGDQSDLPKKYCNSYQPRMKFPKIWFLRRFEMQFLPSQPKTIIIFSYTLYLQSPIVLSIDK